MKLRKLSMRLPGLPGLLFGLCLLGFGPALTMPPVFAQSIPIDRTLVVVNEEAITLSEYRAWRRREALQNASDPEPFDGRIDPRVVERMIDDRIQAQAAARRGIAVSPEDVQRAVAALAKKNNRSPDQLFASLAADGIAPARFRAGVREQQLVGRLVDRIVNARVTVSDREVENYLASHRELIPTDETYEVSHLLISLEGKSDDQVRAELENLAHIRETVAAGRSFAKAVEEFSDAPDREEGGYLGRRKSGQLPELFVEALRGTEVGGVSEIIRSENGLHLLKLHDRKDERRMVIRQLLRHILIRPDAQLDEYAAGKLADELYARITAGENFETLARAHSADRVSGLEGGRLGWVGPGDFPPEFESALADLEVNQLSRPLRTPLGYHLVEVLDRRQADLRMEIATRRARQVIFQRKAAAFYDVWYGTIRDSAHVEYIAVDPG